MVMSDLYMRSPPPPPAIDFASPEGKRIFVEALQGGTMEGFFKLISYFQTQSEPTYCGLASLSMVLNALAIDPGRKWKGPWRWFDETMLDCCEPLEIVKKRGISFGKVVCLGLCSGAKVEAFRTSQSTIEEFRNYVIQCSSSDNCHIISAYNRGVFKQSGTGHFSPIGGYNLERDMALILDVARFKYTPHWIPLKLLWDAMDSLDQSLGQHRGFMLISRPHREPGLLYTLSCEDESWISIAKYLTEDVPRLVSSQHVNTVEKILSIVFKSFPLDFNQFNGWVTELRRNEDVNQTLSAEEKSRLLLKQEVLNQVHDSELFKHVNKLFSSSSEGYEDTCVCFQGTNSSKEFCCGDSCMKCIKGRGEEPVTMVSGVLVHDGREKEVDLLVPSTQAKPKCLDGGSDSTVYPSSNDVFTVLIMALPQETWFGIKDQTLVHEMKQLVSFFTLPTLLQEEVLHLRRQLQLLKRCKVQEGLAAPAFASESD